MDVAALIIWIVTALGGFYLLGTWIAKGGPRRDSPAPSRLPAPVVFGHFLLAVGGLVLWIIYVVVDVHALAWASLGVLVVVATLGIVMFYRWVPGFRAPAAQGSAAPAEAHFPVAVVAAHGLVAVATLVLVILAAAEVGSS
ncbi:MAG TPA: hypothetical protein VFJ19_01580 [Nocardioidaceae bacterium]|nr:hypothetical protein [Nocardioidaceae bacterium]